MNPAPRQFVGGRGLGRNTNQARQPMPTVPISLAKQDKSLEERLYSRFRELKPEAVRVTRFKNGSILEEVLLENNPKWFTAVEMEPVLSFQIANSAIERAKARALVRLGRVVPTDQAYQSLTEHERKILLMSQKEWNSFRASQEIGKQTGYENTPPKARGLAFEADPSGDGSVQA
jgi:hypothetical protein